MSLHTIDEVEDRLRAPTLTVRELYAAWEQRVPAPQEGLAGKKTGDRPVRQIPWLNEDAGLARLFTDRALEMEELLLVCDAAREAQAIHVPAGREMPPDLVRVRMNYAAALMRLGSTREARKELAPCAAPDFQPALGRKWRAEIFAQLGDIAREESLHAAARVVRDEALREALSSYRKALQLDPEALAPAVYAAGVSLMLGQEVAAHRDARAVLEIVARAEDSSGANFRTTVARAAGHCVLGRIDEATNAFRELAAFDTETSARSTARLAAVRYRARFLAEALGQARNLFDQAFPPLQLIVFAGHLPDLPGGRTRFPASAIEEVRLEMRATLDRLQARIGLVCAAAGGDLLFIEALRARGGTVHLVLPWSREEFAAASILPFDGPERRWSPLYERALAEAATTRELGQFHEPSSEVGWRYTTEVTAGLALHTARVARLDLQPVALWDQRPGRGAGGTESFVRFWKEQMGLETELLPFRPAAEAGEAAPREVACLRSERDMVRQEVKSMLFADIVGYSKLTEEVIPEFVSVFLDRVSQLTASSRHAPRSINTWGDAFYAVFDFAHDAGCFALELAQLIAEGEAEWLQRGLYWQESGADDAQRQPLNIRIGLHTGPVFLHYDPVVRRLGFTGAHVNRAARIEPVARPGEVYASEEFAALAEVDGEICQHRPGRPEQRRSSAFVCEYAGTMPLAKGYPGRYRIYRVLPLRELAVEELARAAHEDFCAHARARGETPESNASLRPWDELPEDLREANRAQAADVPNKLAALGFELSPGQGRPPGALAMTDAQVEALAEREHERWCEDRQRHGWSYGEQRDNARKRHPSLRPWDQLSEMEKEKDRDAVRNLPHLIEKSGLRLRPREGA